MSHIIILAGGKGSRMQSNTHKVLHEVKGVPIISRLLQNISPICSTPTIIIGHKADEVREATHYAYSYVEQKEQRGTGHAVMCAREALKDKPDETIIILPGDHPLIEARTLWQLQSLHTLHNATVTLATKIVPHFEGIHSIFKHYGRVIRNKDGMVLKIVEYKDASAEERECLEVNLSYYCFNAQWLWQHITALSSHNAASEYYLTDMVKIATDQGLRVAAYPIQQMAECLGINTPEQLLMVEEALV
ncbi:NTP transferase domain-containing protein [Candidatus Parcubacteria bacterium]|nr:NTP transferase domain-containing protein [Candidatus Parcubacteria bacterium]